MTGLAQAGWLVSAALFATILSSVLYLPHVGILAELLLLLVVVVSAIRPATGAMIVVAATPVAWYLASRFWSSTVAWPETIVCAFLAGMSVSALRVREPGRRVRLSVSAPTVLFGAIVIASLVAGLGVKAVRLGPGFTGALVTQLTRDYFIDVRGFPALHAGMLLLEGVLLFAAAGRIAADRVDGLRFLRRMAAAAVLSATLAAGLNLARLLGAAWRGESFWTSLVDLADRFRWNVHYADFNAAGSYFVMAALVAAALAVGKAEDGRRKAEDGRRKAEDEGRTEDGRRKAEDGGRKTEDGRRRTEDVGRKTEDERRRRQARRRRTEIAWVFAAATITTALWLTSSRVAVLAGILAPGAVLLVWEISRGKGRTIRAAAVAVAGIALVVVVAIWLPQRGSQKSSLLAADVRLGLIQTGARMIASRPGFGIGLGEFYQRSGEFSSPELIAAFPVAVHENAHNNFMQVAAELGVAGGVLFAWLMAAALVAIARRALAARGGLPVGPDLFLSLTLAALGAFALTCLGGHPLLIPEPGYVFWTMLGVATGSVAAAPPHRSSRLRWLVPIGLLAIALTLPWRLRATAGDADLEHVGIGVSQTWQTSPDGTKYREAHGPATLFVAGGSAFKFSVYPLADQPVRLEVKLDGRVADVVTLAPRQWNHLAFPARTEISRTRFGSLDLRVVGDDTAIWITKVEPIAGR